MKKTSLLIAVLAFAFLPLSCRKKNVDTTKGDCQDILFWDRLIETSPDGSWMTATIDGKKWEAIRMREYEQDNHYDFLGHDKCISVRFRGTITPNGVYRFHPLSVMEVTISGDEFVFYSDAGVGSFIQTFYDGNFLEGTFSGVASNQATDRTIKITDGRARLKLTP